MCEFAIDEKVQCIDASPASHPLASLFGVPDLRLNAIYKIHGKLICPACGQHWFVRVDIGDYWWESERFAKLEPPRDELTDRLCRYNHSNNPDGKPDPVRIPDPKKVPELEPADAL